MTNRESTIKPLPKLPEDPLKSIPRYAGRTHSFDESSLNWINNLSADILATRLIDHRSPLMALLALTEIMLAEKDANVPKEESKLAILLANEELTDFWRLYKTDSSLQEIHHTYASALEHRLKIFNHSWH